MFWLKTRKLVTHKRAEIIIFFIVNPNVEFFFLNFEIAYYNSLLKCLTGIKTYRVFGYNYPSDALAAQRLFKRLTEERFTSSKLHFHLWLR
jgi:hypothetical protein